MRERWHRWCSWPVQWLAETIRLRTAATCFKLPLPWRLCRPREAESRDHLSAASLQGELSFLILKNGRCVFVSASIQRISFCFVVIMNVRQSIESMASSMNAKDGIMCDCGEHLQIASTAYQSRHWSMRKSYACTEDCHLTWNHWNK